MSLSDPQRRHLRALAHDLKPVVLVGDKGVTESLLRELDLSLAHHELLKVRVKAGDRDQRDALVGRLCAASGAELVQRIGHVAVLYRAAEPPRLKLP